MDNITQEQIDAKIQIIDNAEEPESVNNRMVAEVMTLLNYQIGLMAKIVDLENEETARQNADILLQDYITALQTAMNGKADLQSIDNAKRLRFSQVPVCFISYLTASASAPTGISANQTWLKKEGNNYTICYHTSEGDDVELGPPQYILYYNGNAIYRWGGSTLGAFVEIVDLGDYFSNGKLKSSALPDNLPSGGGMSDDIYNAIKTNIETLRSMLYTLIKTWLANLAFTNGRPSDQTLSPIASAFNNWPSNGGGGGGETPTPSTPSLTLRENNSAGAVIANNSEVNVGTAQESNSYVARKTIYIKGENLSEDLVVSLNGTAGLSTGMGLSGTIRASEAEAGTSLVLIYNGTSGTASGSLSISSNEVSININLRAAYMSQGGGGTDPDPETDTVNVFTHLLNMTKTSGGNTATKGSPYAAEISTASPCTYNDDLRVYMGGVNITSQCTITDITGGKRVVTPNVTGDIMVIATARTGNVTIKSSAQIDLKINGDIVNYVTSGSDFIYTWSGDSITSIAVGNTSNFINATSIKEVDFGGVPLKAAKQLFQGCTGLTKVENIVVHIDSQAQANGVFANCTSLTSITGLNTWKVELATSMANMFNGVQLTSLDISGWVCNSITSVANMFSASALTDITIGYFNTGTITAESGLTLALSVSGSTVTVHCKSKTPPILNPDNNWLKNRGSNAPYSTSKTVYVKCPANCLAAYQAGAGWDSVGYHNGVVPQLSEES